MRCEQRIPDPETVLILTATEAQELESLTRELAHFVLWDMGISEGLAQLALDGFKVRALLNRVARALAQSRQ